MLREEDAATSLENVATKPLEVGLACCIRLTLAAQRLLNDHVEVLLVLVCQCTSFLAHLSELLFEVRYKACLTLQFFLLDTQLLVERLSLDVALLAGLLEARHLQLQLLIIFL